jgi:geranylgeranyl diphosphate/geranylgeranyl-bacteriochlorophyllide a reductase
MDPCDAAVVGGGPAGAWAAYTLARRGARVTIFDPSHPREKPCGGGVTGRALALVADSIDQGGWPASVIRSARFTDTPKQRSAVVTLEDDGAGRALIVADRATFDARLLDAALRAGARLDRSRVSDVRVGADSVVLDTSAGPRRAAFVIGADGANSLVRRRVAAPFRRDQLSIATGFFAHGVTSDQVAIEFTSDPAGYIWSFPRPTHLAIGICAQADAGVTAATLRAHAARWIAATGIADGARLEPYSWPIPSLGAVDLRSVALSGERWALVGDAAGLVDPITREGIYFAIASGQWIADALNDDDVRRYDARARDEAIPELTHAAQLKAGFFRPAFTGLLMRSLQRSDAIRGVMADLIAGRQSYRSLKWRLVRTFEWRLAFNTMRCSITG